MERKKLGLWCKRVLAGFLASMAALTFLSRALDSVTVIQVTAGYVKQGVVKYSVTGDGVFEAENFIYITLPELQQVGKIKKGQGQAAKAGDVLLVLQMEGLLKEKEELEEELQKAELLLEQERLSAVPVPKVTQETLALQQLEAAQKELEAGNQELLEARDVCSVKKEDLSQEYRRKSERTREEAREDARRSYKSAKRAYDSAVASMESAIKRAEREVEDKQKKLDRLEEEGASEALIDAAELELLRAQEDLDSVTEENDAAVEEARVKKDNAQEDYEDSDYNSMEDKEQLRKDYENAVEAEEQKVKDAEKRVRDLEESLYQSMQQLENARVTDAGTQATEQMQRQSSALRQKSMELDIQKINKKLDKVNGLIALNGEITAPVDGVVADLKVADGDRIAEGSQIKLADSRLRLKALIDKDSAQLLKAGSRLTVKEAGEQRTFEAEVESVNLLAEEDRAEVTALIPEGEGSYGGSAQFSVNMESGAYSMVIPIEALREDDGGYFCLAAMPEKTVLGEEMTAKRVNLEVLEKSTISAAVTGAVSPDTPLIISSNKAVGEGDRVRVMTE